MNICMFYFMYYPFNITKHLYLIECFILYKLLKSPIKILEINSIEYFKTKILIRKCYTIIIFKGKMIKVYQ